MTHLVDILRSKQFVSGQEIASKLSISRAAVHKRILKLRSAGYSITGHRNLGYSLHASPDIIGIETIETRLSASDSFIKHFIYQSEITSTQTAAKESAENGCPEGTVVITESQTASYGRFKRNWVSPKGGIWFSVVLRPKIATDKVPQIALIMSIAAARTLRKLYDVDVMIKWPNDLYIGSRKLAGMLVEMSAEIGGLNWVVAGIGLNANNALPAEFSASAITLKEVLTRQVDRNTLIFEILANLSQIYYDYTKYGFARFRNEYNSLSMLNSKVISVVVGGRVVRGKVEGADENGFLRIKTPSGKSEKIIAGDITILTTLI